MLRFLLCLMMCGVACSPAASVADDRVYTGAEELVRGRWFQLKDKRVAVVANHTARVFGETHLVDTLLGLGVQVVRVFAPEHGFRGRLEAGAAVKDDRDGRTGLPIVSLYGQNKKPTPAQLQDVDVVVFDIQDVGARFYTYSSTLAYVLEACAENGKRLLVLDRPNPNGWWVDGPMLEPAHKSFVGLYPVPLVHGMTMGEYAHFLNGEYYQKRCDLAVIACKGYRHAMRWVETGLTWRAPSPNLPTVHSAEVYPLVCWFEGTPVSVGRGTDRPFAQVGFPYHLAYQVELKKDSILAETGLTTLRGWRLRPVAFRPESQPEAAVHPPYEGKVCYGARVDSLPAEGDRRFIGAIELLTNFYREYGAFYDKNTPPEPFFTPFFAKLVGNATLQRQIQEGQSAEAIYQSWQPETAKFRRVRAKYLLYSE